VFGSSVEINVDEPLDWYSGIQFSWETPQGHRKEPANARGHGSGSNLKLESGRLGQMHSASRSGAANDTRKAEGGGSERRRTNTDRPTSHMKFVLESLMTELARGPGRVHTTRLVGVHETARLGQTLLTSGIIIVLGGAYSPQAPWLVDFNMELCQ